jgi:hypothetical protein
MISIRKEDPHSACKPRSALTLLLAILMVSAPLARAQFTFSTNNGAITITAYTGQGGAVTIPDIVGGLPVTTIGATAFYNNSLVTSVSISSNVNTIGEAAFYSCSGLTTLIIPSNVFSLGDSAFSGCYGLTNASLACRSIGYSAFINCQRLASVTMSTNVTSIADAAFESCTSLTNAPIPSSVTNIVSPFVGCVKLAAITVDAQNPEYTNVNGVLFDKSLTTLVECPAGRSGTFLIPASVTNIGGDAFARCTNLTSVSIPSGVLSIGSGAFRWCSGLASITVPDGVTSIGGAAFEFCPALTNATLGSSLTSIQSDLFDNCTGLSSVTIPGSVTSIGVYAFLSCNSLSNVTIPNGVTSLGRGAFAFSGLAKVTIPASVASIGDQAFYFCWHLTNVTIANGVTSIGTEAFWDCTSLASIVVPTSVTSMGSDAFESCSSLTSITVDPLNPVYSSMDGVLFDKSRTTLIDYPPAKSGAYAVPNGVARLADMAFEYCSGLTSVTIAASVTNLGSGTFYACNNLTSVTILGSVTSIGYEDFFACSSLATIALPKTLTSIGPNAFEACPGLVSITLPAGVTNIGDEAFYQSHTSIYFQGNAPSIGSSTFALGGGTIYYLPGTTGWGPTFGGLPAVLWNPQAQTGDPSFGVRSNRFGFNIVGSSNLVIVVEASADLAQAAWLPVGTNILTGGSSYFSDPQWSNYPSRFYRLRSP